MFKTEVLKIQEGKQNKTDSFGTKIGFKQKILIDFQQ